MIRGAHDELPHARQVKASGNRSHRLPDLGRWPRSAGGLGRRAFIAAGTACCQQDTYEQTRHPDSHGTQYVTPNAGRPLRPPAFIRRCLRSPARPADPRIGVRILEACATQPTVKKGRQKGFFAWPFNWGNIVGRVARILDTDIRRMALGWHSWPSRGPASRRWSAANAASVSLRFRTASVQR